MRNAILGFTFAIVTLYMFLIQSSLMTKDVRQNEIEQSLNSAIKTTMETAYDKNSTLEIHSNEELMQLFNENLLTQITSDSDITVNFMGVDYENGLLDVQVSSKFKYPYKTPEAPEGKPGKVTARRSIILDDGTGGMTIKHNLLDATTFNNRIDNNIEKIIFTTKRAPISVDTVDMSQEVNNTVVSWTEGTTMYVSSQNKGQNIILPENCDGMFANKPNLKKVDLTKATTVKTKSMRRMFDGDSSLVTVDLSQCATKNVEKMAFMFNGCSSLENIYITPSLWKTDKVVKGDNGYDMFSGCNKLPKFNTDKLDIRMATYKNGYLKIKK